MADEEQSGLPNLTDEQRAAIEKNDGIDFSGLGDDIKQDIDRQRGEGDISFAHEGAVDVDLTELNAQAIDAQRNAAFASIANADSYNEKTGEIDLSALRESVDVDLTELNASVNDKDRTLAALDRLDTVSQEKGPVSRELRDAVDEALTSTDFKAAMAEVNTPEVNALSLGSDDVKTPTVPDARQPGQEEQVQI